MAGITATEVMRQGQYAQPVTLAEAQEALALTLHRVPRLGLLGLGGSGLETLARYLPLGLREGAVVSYAGIDTAAALPAPACLGPLEGQALTSQDVLVLGKQAGDGSLTSRLTALHAQPLLRERYLDGGLLRGIPVSTMARLDWRGIGGAAFPVLSTAELDLDIAPLRAFLDAYLTQLYGQPAPGRHAGPDLLAEALAQMEAPAPVPQPAHIVVVAGGTGSAGAGICPFAGYLLREQAAARGLPRPTIWLLVAGPSIYRHLVPRTDLNWAATLDCLEFLGREGLRERAWADGSVSRAVEPPYEAVLLLDEPRKTTDAARERATDAELDGFFWRLALTAQQLLRPEVRDTVAAVGLDADLADDAVARTNLFGTVQLETAGLDRATAEDLLTLEIARRRTAELTGRLAGA